MLPYLPPTILKLCGGFRLLSKRNKDEKSLKITTKINTKLDREKIPASSQQVTIYYYELDNMLIINCESVCSLLKTTKVEVYELEQ